MLAWAVRLIRPPARHDYVDAQRLRLLHTMLGWTLLAALVGSLMNFATKDPTGGVFMLGLASACFVGLVLNHVGRSRLAAFLLLLALFIAVTLDASAGIGIHAATLFVYPVLIVMATVLMASAWAGWAVALACTVSLLVMVQLQGMGYVRDPLPPSWTRIAALVLIFLGTAGVAQVIRRTWNDNLEALIDSYDHTLQGWALALEYRDGETAGHCQRVVALSVLLAEELGCTPAQVHAIKRGAYLHDIGKMAVPDAILKKPGPLTAEEREVIQQHPVLGKQFIGDVPFLAPAAEVMYAHHESWDGSGYPLGLAGEAIPLGARVFSVVDQWDALNSDRPYRPAWPRQDVIAYIAEKAGTAFDPRVAEAFLRIIVDERDLTSSQRLSA